MKHRILLLLLAFVGLLTATAQQTVRYGTLSREALLREMPEMQAARTQMDSLRAQYEREAQYNERSFRRQYSEYLQAQKNLPQAILLKRQRDLQAAMESALAYRREAENLLQKAEKDLHAPIYARLDAAIRAVGSERGYEMIINLDVPSHPYILPSLTEDATPWVRGKLQSK